MCLQEDLRRAGIDPAPLRRVGDRGMAENVAALQRGEIDAIQVFEPFIETLLTERAAHLWYAAAERGPTSYTTFYAPRPLLETRRDELRRMVRAVYRVQKWVAAAEPETIAEVVASFFPDLERPYLAGALARYQRLGIWGRNPRLPRGGYQRLAAGLVSGGLVRAAASYEQAVDNSLAEEVVADDPPPIRVG
jgi:NitT/TauT family transport system substrate-binding protein